MAARVSVSEIPSAQQSRLVLSATFNRPDYKAIQEKCQDFLQGFIGDSDEFDERDAPSKYMVQLESIANKESKVLTIDLDDLSAFDSELAENFEKNAKRYIKIFEAAADLIMPSPTVIFSNPDVYDILEEHRNQLVQASRAPRDNENNEDADRIQDSANTFPDSLKRRYEIQVLPRTNKKKAGMRTIGADNIGSIVTVSGIVTRITEVRPLIIVATYTCDVCGHEVYQPVENREFTPVKQCPSERCRLNRQSGQLYLQTRGSKFQKFQEVRLQEMPDQVPVGNVPRSITVHLRGELTRTVNAGNEVNITGIFLPTPYSGYQKIKAGLVADTFLHALSVQRQKKTYVEYENETTDAERVQFLQEARNPNILRKLSYSLCPEIHGHEDVKLSLLMLLVGGVNKKRIDGMKIRGDINILLMGDPGVAKSQLLKQVGRIAPRGVYTTGKGSSGVGLTAAVVRDNVTGEMVLEGGALVLADMGICCIDEFDKMEDADRTAIHEVMEQQTVSIAKAGVTTTLNARTSILAAANPLYGRYKLDLSPEKNINLPPALMSRFDLIFLLRDVPDVDKDRQLAEHILFVHQRGRHPELEFTPFPSDFLRKYIASAKTYEPAIPSELTNFIVQSYVQMRKNGSDTEKDDIPCTPRVLLSILRISQARARLRFAEAVSQEDVEESIRLMTASTQSTRRDGKKGKAPQDVSSSIWQIIKEFSDSSSSMSLDSTMLLNQVRMRGFSQTQFEETLSQYEELNILQVSEGKVLLIN